MLSTDVKGLITKFLTRKGQFLCDEMSIYWISFDTKPKLIKWCTNSLKIKDLLWYGGFLYGKKSNSFNLIIIKGDNALPYESNKTTAQIDVVEHNNWKFILGSEHVHIIHNSFFLKRIQGCNFKLHKEKLFVFGDFENICFDLTTSKTFAIKSYPSFKPICNNIVLLNDCFFTLLSDQDITKLLKYEIATDSCFLIDFIQN